MVSMAARLAGLEAKPNAQNARRSSARARALSRSDALPFASATV